ncbi:uncharacterized protein si:ch211-106e7.2 isoform X2 [Boleophthalmus pectinirostris]|uniref:uncharacterized protein si:ch211-106e7.2 isoform X2 n=1 Tax=Boleophthalmus pectinirostris TaxID=150288 RepID=UPI0024324F19|nr:uncharacterized protein si:ch211-106e7.2 isoform X2 [Boleophthalmus pectinirostris]
MDAMQSSTWTNGPCRQFGQLQSTVNQTTCSNHGSNGACFLSPPNQNGQFTVASIGTKQVSTQRKHIGPSKNHMGYHTNSTQISTLQCCPTANMNTGIRQQVMYAQKTPMPGNSQSFSINNYEAQGMQQNLNQTLISQTGNVPTSPSTMQSMYQTRQHSPVQNHIYNQSCQQTVHMLPSYSQAVLTENLYSRSSQGPSTQRMQGYAVSDQTNYNAPQTNYKCAVQAGNVPFHTNNTSNLANAHTNVPVQTQYNSYSNQEHMQQPIVRGKRNVQITQKVINTSCNVSSMQLPSLTCIPENSNYDKLLHLNKRPAPPQTAQNMPTQDHSANSSRNINTKFNQKIPENSNYFTELFYLHKKNAPLQTAQNTPTQDHSANSSRNMNTKFYQKMNDVPKVNLNVPLTQTSPEKRSEAFEKIDSISSAQASCGTNNTLLSHTQRAVAVVLPLSLEDSHCQLSPDSDDNPKKNAQLSSLPLQKLQKMISSTTEKAIIHKKSPCLASLLDDCTANLSSLPLTFAELVKETPENLQITRLCEKKLKNNKTSAENKPSEQPLSSVPTNEWTLKTLSEKISAMENESKKSANEHRPYCGRGGLMLLLLRFWNGRLKTLCKTLKKRDLFHYTTEFRHLCRKVYPDTVVLSEVKSQTDLNKYYILQHDEVYEEKVPYSSTWLNINSQLDDIDKEFGFPYFLKSSQYECGDNKDTDIQSGQKEIVQTGVKTVQPEEPKPQNEKSDQSRKSVASMSDNIDEEMTILLQSKTNSHKDSDRNKCESNEQSSDPSFLFITEVLSPEEAKVIFEKTDNSDEEMTILQSETNSHKDSDRNKCESNEQSSDPSFLFITEVLSPEEAKVIFEKTDNSDEEMTILQSETNSHKDSDKNKCESNEQSSDSSFLFITEVLSPEEAKVIFEKMDNSDEEMTILQSETNSHKDSDKNKCESNEQSSDSSCLFITEVLSPEEAKVIFEKTDNIGEEMTILLQSETNSHKDSDKNKCESNEQSSDSSCLFKTEVLSPEEAKVIFEKTDNSEEMTILQSETNSHKDSDKNKCESNEQSSDSSCLFQTEVLSPEEAKVIFEKTDHNSTAEKMEPSTSETIAPNEQNGTMKQTCNPTTVEMVCCLDKLKEKILGVTSEKKCECKMVPDQNKKTQSVSTDNSFSTEISDLTEDDGIMSVVPLHEPGGVIVLSESDDEIQVSEENQTPSSNHTNEQDFTSTETSLIASPDKNTLQTSIERKKEVTTSETICEIKEQGDNCQRGEGEIVDLEKEEKQDAQVPIHFTISPHLNLNDSVQKYVNKPKMDTDSDAALLHSSKTPKLSSPLKSQTIFESFSKRKNNEPTAKAELVLFGSERKKYALAGSRGFRSLSVQLQPPEKVYVKMNSLTTSDSQEDAESQSKISVKRRIHESWRKSFPFNLKKIKRKNNIFTIVNARSKVKCKDVNSKRKVNDSDDGLCRKKRRIRTVSESVNLLHKCDAYEVKSLQGNVLKFKLLPSSFSFEEESKNSDSAMDSTVDENTIPGKAEG